MVEVLEFNDMFYTNFEPKMKNRFIMEIDGIFISYKNDLLTFNSV